MTVPSVSVTSGSRLHFGMFSFGHADARQFGGLGLMVEAPAVQVRVVPAQRLQVTGLHAERARSIADQTLRWLAANTALVSRDRAPDQAPCRVEVLAAPRQHVGLGVGTQLSLSVATAVLRFFGYDNPPGGWLANITGRAERSSVGLHGFLRGGLILEAGKLLTGAAGPVVSRVAVPKSWSWVLCVPRQASGLFGASERQAFDELPPAPREVTAELCRLATLELLPAAVEANFPAFSSSLYEFGVLAGGCFAARQHGPFLDQTTAALVERIRAEGHTGVAQTSWGPTVFAVLDSHSAAESLVATLGAEQQFAEYELLVTAARNDPAAVQGS